MLDIKGSDRKSTILHVSRTKSLILIQTLLLSVFWGALLCVNLYPFTKNLLLSLPIQDRYYGSGRELTTTQTESTPTYTFEGKGIQDWMLDLLKPNPPKQIKKVAPWGSTRLVTYRNSPEEPNDMIPVCVTGGVYVRPPLQNSTTSADCIENPDPEKVYTQYLMGGVLYDMSSSSSRLQRAPLVHQFVNIRGGFRFASNPTVSRHPNSFVGGSKPYLQPISIGSSYKNDLWLAIQLGSGETSRGVLNNRSAYSARGHQWKTTHVSLTLSLSTSGYDSVSKRYNNFTIKYSDFALINATTPHEFGLTDMRVLETNDNRLMAYGGDYGYTTVYNATNIHGYRQFRFTDRISAHPPRRQKNWMAMQVNHLPASENHVMYMVVYFAPFTVARCTHACELHIFNALTDSNLPEDRIHWRGSTSLIPLPGHPHLLIGSVHRRFEWDERSDWRNGSFKDRYDHRFVLVDSIGWLPIGYTDPFCIFGHTDLDMIDWFEFIVGIQFTQTEFIMSFGYNDYEPWLAILPISQMFSFFKPSYENNTSIRATLNDIKHHYSQYMNTVDSR